MATLFVVENTAGTLNITLEPGQLNGPGATQRASDMRLYGMGALLWGEGMDTNILRLTESFACPDKGELGGSPIAALNVPQDETDLGPGRGITVPIDGQLWWNTTTKILYVYDASITTWVQAGKIPVQDEMPPNPNIGDLWYDTENVGGDGCGDPIYKVYDPGHPDADLDGWVVIASAYVKQCGDYMTGELSMVDPVDIGTPASYSKITELQDPTSTYDAANKNYVDTEVATASGALTSHANDGTLHLTALQNTFLDDMEANCTGFGTLLAADFCHLAGYDSSSGDVWNDIDGRVLRSGDEMTSYLKLGPVGTPLIPVADNDAVPKKYVDDAIGGSFSGGAARNVRYFTTLAGTGILDGDIHTVGSTVYVYASGAWRQIFPALYS